MIAEKLIREALSPDPLEIAKEKVQTRAIGAEYRRKQALVHAALKKGIVPTEPGSPSCGRAS